jgi:hypothetical protein
VLFIHKVTDLLRGLVTAIRNFVFKGLTFNIAIKCRVPRDSQRRVSIILY